MAFDLITRALRSGLTTKSADQARQISGRGFWGMVREPFAGGWQRGVTVDPIGTLTSFGAVYACITRIATDIAKLELKLMAEGPGGIEAPENAASPYWRVLRKPNAYQNRIQWLTHWITSKLMFGNAYQLKQRNDMRGMVTALYPIDPRRCTPMVTPEGDVYYSLGGDDLARVPAGAVVPASEIIHDRGVTLWHPLVGVSPIHACAVSATQGLRIQRNSATFFENMSRPSGMLTAPGSISDETAARLKTEWEQNYSKENIGRLAIGGDGLKYEAMTIPAVDAQMIEQLNWTVEDVARAFGVPAYKIGAGPMPTNNNVEALESQYYSGCLQILIESVELCLTEGLSAPPGSGVELELEGLLRMDSKTQIDMLVAATGGAIMKPNEGRAKRNLPPVTGGDSLYMQQQNFSLAALAKRDAKEDPFGTEKPVATAPDPVEKPEPGDTPTEAARAIEAAAQKMIGEARDLIASHTDSMQADSDRRRAEYEEAKAASVELMASIPQTVKAAIAECVPSAAPAEDEAERLARSIIAGFDELEPVGA